jgi:WD40 repeat protein
MTQPGIPPLLPYEEYLYLDAHAWRTRQEGSFQLYENLLGPDQQLGAFALMAALVAARRCTALRRAQAADTALHQAIRDAGGVRPDGELSRTLGPPFRAGEPSSLYALRALAALGLALVERDLDPALLRVAVSWHREARGASADVSVAWTPAALAGDDPTLRRCMDCLAEIAAVDGNDPATLAVAVTLRRLRWPTVEPYRELLLADPAKAPGGRPTRTARRRQHAITALVDQGTDGAETRLAVSVDRRRPAGLIPDPEQMALFAADPAFQDALARAWQQAGRDRIRGLVTWSASTAAGPLRYVSGESAGAAFAVVLNEASRFRRPLASVTVIRRLVSGNAVTGRIDNRGFLLSVEGYHAKLGALANGSRVIIPTADTEKATQAIADDAELTIVPVVRWQDAARQARRPKPIVIVRQALALAIVAALIGGWAVIRQRHDTELARDAAISVQLASLSETLDHEDPPAAAALAAAAWQASPTSPAQESLLDVLAQPLRAVLSAGGPFTWAGFDPRRGTVLATVGKNIQLWNTATDRQLGAPIAVPGGARGAAFSPNGTLLATADSDGTVRVWDIATGRQVGPPLAASAASGVNAVAFSPGGTLLATADADGTARLWNAETHQQIGVPLPAGDAARSGGQVMDVAFSPKGTILATASLDGTARLWNVQARRQIGRSMTEGPGGTGQHEIRNVAFSPDGATLATVTNDTGVLLWSVASQRRTGYAGTTGEVGNDAVFGPASGHSGAMLAIADSAGIADLWNTVNRSVMTSLDAEPAGAMTSVAVSSDGAALATVSANGTAWLWDLSQSHAIRPSIEFGRSTYATLGPGGRTLAAVGFDHAIRVWNLPTGRQAGPSIPARVAGSVNQVAFSPDGALLATADGDGTVRFWNLATGRQTGAPIRASTTTGLAAVAFSPDGRQLATADDDGIVRLWNRATGRQSGAAIQLHDGVDALSFSPDGTMLATVTASGSARLWDVDTGHPASGLPALTGVIALAFDPRGGMIATADSDGTARLWILATGREFGEPMAATSVFSVSAVGFSPDGSLLATGGDDGWLRLFDVATTHEIGPAMSAAANALGVGGVAFSADGAILADFGNGNLATQWDVAFPRDLPSAACSIAGGPLSQQQWNTDAPSVPYIRACA